MSTPPKDRSKRPPPFVSVDELIRRFQKGAAAEELWLKETPPQVRHGDGIRDDLLDPVPPEGIEKDKPAGTPTAPMAPETTPDKK